MIGRFAHIALLALLAQPFQPVQPAQSGQPEKPAASAGSDLDQFMARVLARRDDNWRKLQQYVLEEREQAELLGPGRVRLYGKVRDYTWYIRDGVFVRSPLKFDGVTLSEDERRKYEDEWLAREKARDEKKRSKESGGPGGSGGTEVPPSGRPEVPPAVQSSERSDVGELMQLAKEPQFVSAAYFLKFKFEQGRYAFAGPERYEGRRVLKIEYYPARLFTDDEHQGKQGEDSKTGQRLERQFNKAALVTLWVEPDSHQIVKYVFENIGMDFLPGRSMVRVDDVAATMEMGQPFAGVWLPRHIDGHGGVTLANGTYQVRYVVDYREYREATTKATIR
jgi:hypothetical protein